MRSFLTDRVLIIKEELRNLKQERGLSDADHVVHVSCCTHFLEQLFMFER